MTVSERDIQDWHERLIRTFRAVGSRRVAPEAVDDIVQDALTIVYEKGFSDDSRSSPPAMAWCLTVLRNVIGNHYRKVVRRNAVDGVDGSAVADIAIGAHGPNPRTPLEALEREEASRAVRDAIAAMDGEGPCAEMLDQLARGEKVSSMAEQIGVTAAVLSRRLYRCRQKLLHLLEERGISP